MKTLHIIFFGAIMAVSTVSMFGQDRPKKIETITFEVTGVCGMCEDRIEQAALIKGVKFADWDRQTQMVKVMYKPKKTNPMAIQEAIAAAGHDTGDVKAADSVYSTLPDCCLYRDGVDVH